MMILEIKKDQFWCGKAFGRRLMTWDCTTTTTTTTTSNETNLWRQALLRLVCVFLSLWNPLHMTKPMSVTSEVTSSLCRP